MSKDSAIDTIDQAAADSLDWLVETEAVKFEDLGIGAGLGMGAASVTAAMSGDLLMAGLAGIQSVSYTGASIGMGDYPRRAALPLYKARDTGRGVIYDRFVADDLRDEIDVDELDDEYPNVDIDATLQDQYHTDSIEQARTALTDDIIEQGREAYIEDPTAIADTDTFLTRAAGETIDDFRLSPDIEHLYTNDDLHPHGIQESLLERFGEFLQDELSGDREQRIEEGLGVLDGTYPLKDEYLETIHDDAWDGEVQDTSDLYDAVLHDMAFQGRSIAHTRDQEFQDELEGRYNAANRFEDDIATEALEDNEYEVYEIEEPDAIATINRELGTCQRNYGKTNSKFQEWAWEDDTTILGFRRDDSDEWIGFTRNYRFEDNDGRDILAVDTWEIPYKDGKEGGTPTGSCDFKNYGDVLHIEALASIQYGLEHDYDFVVAGHSDGRVGDAREVNPGRDTTLHLGGLSDVNKRYGLGIDTEQTVHVLMEDDFSDYRA